MTLRLLILLIPALLQAATQFPVPISSPRPVSEPRFGNAPGNQERISIARGADISVVTWADWRTGGLTLYATRIDSAGTVLDPLGISIHAGATPDAVVWNGEDFLIAATFYVQDARKILFSRLTPAGVVAEKRIFDLPQFADFVDVAGSGEQSRLLYFANGGSSAAYMFDGHGRLVREQPLSPPGQGYWIAGSRSDGEFLILRSFFDQTRTAQECGGACWRVISQRLTSDGLWTSSLESNLPIGTVDRMVLKGGRDGYLLFTVGHGTDIHVIDRQGFWTGEKTTLPIGLFNAWQRPNPVFVEDRFLVSWFEHAGGGVWETYYGEISEKGELLTQQRAEERSGQPVESEFAPISSTTRLLVTSFFEVPGTTQADLRFRLIEAGQVRESRSLTRSAAAQYAVAVAAGRDGFATMWIENGPDANERLMFRTLSPDGEASSEPMELAKRECCDVYNTRALHSFAVASSGSVYLAVWQDSDLVARRFSSELGWLDPAPFVVRRGHAAFGPQSLTSNGTDFLLTWAEGFRIMVRRLPAAGSLEGVSTEISSGTENYEPVVSSNGSDYLVVWSEGQRECNILCVVPPFRILGSRIASNGTPLDFAPLVLEDQKAQSHAPSVAWDGRNYVVIWNAAKKDGYDFHGVRVATDGTILERQADGTGTPVRRATETLGAAGFLAPSRDGVLLLTSEVRDQPGHWDGLVIDATMPLAAVPSLPATRVVDEAWGAANTFYFPVRTLAVALRGNTHLFAFLQIAAPELGRVPRAFTELRSAPSRPRLLRR